MRGSPRVGPSGPRPRLFRGCGTHGCDTLWSMKRLGRYVLGRVLGEGGEGRVYEAVLHGPRGLTKAVALKVLHGGSESLRHEARIGGLLRHRNLVDVYEISDDDGQWFCAMELCPGGTLTDHLPLPPRAVVDVGLQVCAALQYAHEALGMIHLDLKPSNLLLSDGVVKVADLGIARADGFQARGDGIGTPGFMAPEQRVGAPVDARTDVYGLGATLRELSSRVDRPIAPTMDTAGIDALSGTPAALPVDRQPTVEHADLMGVIERCIASLPADRWPDMSALAEALGGVHVSGPGLREVVGWKPAPPPEVHRDTNLGPERDAFVGRRDELARLVEGLKRAGLVTLKGPPGIGKSRLASTAARQWRQETGRPAWFCDLREARGLDDLVGVVARALGVPLRRVNPVVQVGHALAGRGAVVVVLDNFEQIRHLAGVVQQWLVGAPESTFRVTSRTPLRLDAERVTEVEALSTSDAVSLLVARAGHRSGGGPGPGHRRGPVARDRAGAKPAPYRRNAARGGTGAGPRRRSGGAG